MLEELEEKRRGLSCLFTHYGEDKDFDVSEQMLKHTAVLRLAVEEISGKHRK